MVEKCSLKEYQNEGSQLSAISVDSVHFTSFTAPSTNLFFYTGTHYPFNEIEKLIWAAAYFEAEGCIHLRKDGYLDIRIASKKKDSLKFIQSIVNDGKIYRQNTVYVLHFFNTRAVEFLKKILPYTRFRRKQILTALEYDKDKCNIEEYRKKINRWYKDDG